MITKNTIIATHWIQAFNNHDVDALLLLYNETAMHYSPKLLIHQPQTKGWIKGKAALRAWWLAAFIRLPQLHYQLKNTIVNNQQILLEYVRIVPNEPNMMVAEILEIEAGLITQSRVYHG
jgi:hypothetical protein